MRGAPRGRKFSEPDCDTPSVARFLLLYIFTTEFLPCAFEQEADTEADKSTEGAKEDCGNREALNLCTEGRFRAGNDSFDRRDALLRKEHAAGLITGHIRREDDEDHIYLSEHESDDSADFDEIFSAHKNALKRGSIEHGRKKSPKRQSLC